MSNRASIGNKTWPEQYGPEIQPGLRTDSASMWNRYGPATHRPAVDRVVAKLGCNAQYTWVVSNHVHRSKSEQSLKLAALRGVLCVALLALVAALTGCQTVEFYEKEQLNDATMLLEEDPTEVHFLQKVLYSREGSVGGVGTGAGGGCGCY